MSALDTARRELEKDLVVVVFTLGWAAVLSRLERLLDGDSAEARLKGNLDRASRLAYAAAMVGTAADYLAQPAPVSAEGGVS